MASNDWQNALGALLESGSLPEGASSEAPSQEAAESTTRPKERLVISYERKGRAGKEATIISGFNASRQELEQIASVLKSKLGTGGSARGGEILVQGDRREKVAALLRSMGYRI